MEGFPLFETEIRAQSRKPGTGGKGTGLRPAEEGKWMAKEQKDDDLSFLHSFANILLLFCYPFDILLLPTFCYPSTVAIQSFFCYPFYTLLPISCYYSVILLISLKYPFVILPILFFCDPISLLSFHILLPSLWVFDSGKCL